MTFGSFCSGIGAPEAAWTPLGWKCAFVAEIDKACSALLASKYAVPNFGDLNTITAEQLPTVDVWVAGTPCQAFSVAGLRKGLQDDRGNLSLVFVRLLRAAEAISKGPRFVLWENVPGVLSSKDNAFGCFLAGMVGDVEPVRPPGGKWTDAGVVAGLEGVAAWRILDAQYFGLPQRRRRVFVVRCPRDGADPAEILFECQGVRRNPPTRRKAGQGFTHDVAGILRSSGVGTSRAGNTRGQDAVVAVPELSHCLNAGGMGRIDYETESMIAHSLKAAGHDASEDGTGRGTPLVAVPFAQNSRSEVREVGGGIAAALPCEPGMNQQTFVAYGIASDALDRSGEGAGGTAGERSGLGIVEELSPTINAKRPNAVAFQESQSGVREYSTAGTLRSDGPGHDPVGTRVRDGFAVRRLMPIECERCQGFPDNYTLVETTKKISNAKLDEDVVKFYVRSGFTLSRAEQLSRIADGPRYQQLGNSMAVPCIAWIGRRIAKSFIQGVT